MYNVCFLLSFQPAPELVIIPSKKPQVLGSPDKQQVKTDTLAVKEAVVPEAKEEIHDTREDRQGTGDDKQLIVQESEEDEKERRRRRKKEKKEKKRRKRDERSRERSGDRDRDKSRDRDRSRDSAEKGDKHSRDRDETSAAVSSKDGQESKRHGYSEGSQPSASIAQQRDLRLEEKLNNINSPGHTIDKEPKVKFSFGEIVSQARGTKESASVLRRSSLLSEPPKVEFHRADTQDSLQDAEGGIFAFPPSARRSNTSWSPRGAGYNLGDPESSDEENVSPKSPSFFRSVSREVGSDTSLSEDNGRRKLRRRFSRKEKKKKKFASDSD